MYFQDKSGQWYSYNQGATNQASSGGNMGFISGSNASAGVSIEKVGGPVKGSLLLRTTPDQNEKIFNSALESQESHNSGETEYNLYTNNCTDAAVDVVNNSDAGITIENPATTVRPNEWFEELKKVKVTIKTTSGNGVDNTATKIEVPKYEEIE